MTKTNLRMNVKVVRAPISASSSLEILRWSICLFLSVPRAWRSHLRRRSENTGNPSGRSTSTQGLCMLIILKSAGRLVIPRSLGYRFLDTALIHISSGHRFWNTTVPHSKAQRRHAVANPGYRIPSVF